MKITFDWLQDHLKTNFKEKQLLEQLTNIGLEVESLESLSAEILMARLRIYFVHFSLQAPNSSLIVSK